MAPIRYWVWLTTLAGVRSVAIRALLDRFGGPMEVYFADDSALDSVSMLTLGERDALRQKDLTRTERILTLCREKDIQIVTLQDAQYPSRLREISDPPPVLYVRGRLPFMDELPVIAVVGTRRASPYGMKTAFRIGSEIAACGGTLVTGMAYGIDGESARGALSVGGCCVGVLGTAIDVDYPASNAELIRKAAESGAIVSEFPPEFPTAPENFPRRNRIISGLSCGVCVVEAPARSGALITASLALDQGRDVFVVPGNADSPQSKGSNALLRDCAKAVTDGWEILSEYKGLYPKLSKRTATPEIHADELPDRPESTKSEIDKPHSIHYIDLESRLKDYTPAQQTLLRALTDGEKHMDDLIDKSGFSAAKVLAEMTVLTIRGAVRQLPGKRFVLNWE